MWAGRQEVNLIFFLLCSFPTHLYHCEMLNDDAKYWSTLIVIPYDCALSQKFVLRHV